MSVSDNIDWGLLRRQKRRLLGIINLENAAQPVRWDPETVDDLQGLIHLIDAIQDEAVDNHGFPELEVFGPPSKE